MYKLTFLFLIFIINISLSIAQVQKLDLKSNIFLGLGINPNIFYSENLSKGSIEIEAIPHFKYFIGNHMSLCYGISIVYGKRWAPDYLQRNSAITSSPAFRYYLFKNNLFFIEAGIQTGYFNNHGDDYNKKGCFNQAGVGLGINMLTAYHEGWGRFAFEFLIRDNFPFKSFDEKNVFIPFNRLGSGIAVYYLLEPARKKKLTAELAKQDAFLRIQDSAKDRNSFQEKAIKSIHSIYVSSPTAISYGYEKSITNQIAIDVEASIEMLAGLLYDTAFVRPALKIEPRYYYGFQKRASRGQNVRHNSSDFLCLEAGYNTVLSGKPVNSGYEFHLIPKWGFRRALGKHFIFDFSTGYGIYGEVLNQKLRIGHTPGLDIRLGYCFKSTERQ